MKTYGMIVADNGSNWYFQGFGVQLLEQRDARRTQAGAGGGVSRRSTSRA